MHHDIPEIRDNPLAEGETINAHRTDVVIFFNAVGNFSRDGLQLRLGRPGADDEKVGESGHVAQVYRDDVFGLFIGGDACAQAG